MIFLTTEVKRMQEIVQISSFDAQYPTTRYKFTNYKFTNFMAYKLKLWENINKSYIYQESYFNLLFVP